MLQTKNRSKEDNDHDLCIPFSILFFFQKSNSVTSFLLSVRSDFHSLSVTFMHNL